jgi:hypothetical protein
MRRPDPTQSVVRYVMHHRRRPDTRPRESASLTLAEREVLLEGLRLFINQRRQYPAIHSELVARERQELDTAQHLYTLFSGGWSI